MKHEGSTPTPQERAQVGYNGLAEWRERQRLEKEQKMAELAEHRKHATTEVRDGRKFKVVRLPDRYDFTQKPPHLAAQLRGPKRKQAAA